MSGRPRFRSWSHSWYSRLELVVEDHTVDGRALFPKTRPLVEVRPMQLSVVGQLARPAHVRVERLFPLVVAFPPMRVEEVLSAVGQRHGSVATIDGHQPDEAFVTQVAEIRVPRVETLVAHIAEVALGHDAKCAYGRERSAVVAVQFVPMVAVNDKIAFETGGNSRPSMNGSRGSPARSRASS